MTKQVVYFLEENDVPRTQFEARGVAGSVEYKKRKNIMKK